MSIAGKRAGLFLSTPSARRATRLLRLCGAFLKQFLSTPSARRATRTVCCTGGFVEIFLSTPSARRATDRMGRSPEPHKISIHALREEGDYTLLCRRRGALPYFYPRPPRGGRLERAASGGVAGRISIHALREEGDLCTTSQVSDIFSFLSTPSARRATIPPLLFPDPLRDFYPRPPRGGRPYSMAAFTAAKNFYPRPPRGGRPGVMAKLGLDPVISIHALREEGDRGRPPFGRCL